MLVMTVTIYGRGDPYGQANERHAQDHTQAEPRYELVHVLSPSSINSLVWNRGRF
jgi:hypothetical protein